MVDILEKVHESGYVYGDLKLDNIMIGQRDNLPSSSCDDAFQGVSLNLIDFGFATKFLDKNGCHLQPKKVEMFQGNLIFSSIDQMKFNSTSRRDDLISLAYMLSYLIHGGRLLGFDPEIP
jgi:serine/threonine protein kinase